MIWANRRFLKQKVTSWNKHRVLYLDAVNDHFWLKYTQRETSKTLVENGTECYHKTQSEKVEFHNLSNFNRTSLNTTMFWQVLGSKTLEISYAKKTVLYNEWDQFLGPVTRSKFDKINFQFICLEGKLEIFYQKSFWTLSFKISKDVLLVMLAEVLIVLI